MDARVVEVVERPLGSALAADAAAGASTVTVWDASDFDDAGTLALEAETAAYTLSSLDAGTLALAAPLASAHLTDAPVTITPYSVERLATLIAADDGDEEEGMTARVPHALWDRIPVGVRDDASRESVQADYQADELVILDVTGQVPDVDGSYLDPGTLPPVTVTDGLAPAGSPTPSIVGGIGTLHVLWNAVGNADPVTYDVHLSAVSGFTPGPVNLAASTDATAITLRVDSFGFPLDYATVYYVQLVARDADGAASPGAEASGQPVQVTGPDIAAEAVTADHIVANAITADKLASVLVLASQIMTAESGQRVVIDPAGIRLIAPDESVLVNLPTDPAQSPTFAGNVVTGGLTVTGNARIQGLTNAMEKGSQLTLQAQLGAPAAAPSLAFEYDTDLTGQGGCIGLDCDPAGRKSDGSTGMTYLFLCDDGSGYSVVEWDPVTKVASRVQRFSAYGPDPLGVARVGTGTGSMIGVLYVGTDGLVKLRTYDYALFGTGAPNPSLGTSTLAFGSTGILNTEVRLGTDGTNWHVLGWNGTASTSVKRVTVYDGSVALNPAVIDQYTLTGGLLRGAAGATRNTVVGVSLRGGQLVAVTFRTIGPTELATCELYSTSTHALLTADGNTWCPNAIPSTGNSVDTLWQGGVSYDTVAARFRGLCGSGILVKFSAWTWPADATGSKWWLGTTFYQATGGLETTMSPQGSIQLDGANPSSGRGTASDRAMYGQVRVVSPPIPTDASTQRVYMLRASASPAATTMRRQTPAATSSSPSSFTSYVRTYDGAGALYVATNTFPAGTSVITGDLGAAVTAQWKLGGDGSFVLPRATIAQRQASPAKAQFQWNETRGVPEYWDGAAWRTGAEIVTVNLNLASVNAGTSGSTAVSIPGLNVGDVAIFAGSNLSGAGVQFTFFTAAVCTVAGQVTLRYFNADTAARDPGAADFYFLIVRAT